MSQQDDDAIIPHLVYETLAVHDGQQLDTVILSLAEVLARILAESSCDPEEALLCLVLSTRRWLASGRLPPSWLLYAPMPSRPQ